MKNLLIFLLLLSATAHSQLQSFVVRSGASGDTLFAFNPSTGEYTQLTKQDTSSLPRFTDKVKGLITWGNVQGKPSTYTPSTHSHVIADVTGLQAAIDAKGTSDFDGTYSSLTGKPTLFDGTWSSLTGKPTISGTNTGDQDLSGYTPVTRTINTHPLSANVTVTASDVGLGSVDNTSDASKPVSTAQQTAINLKVNISDSAAMLSPYLRSNVAAATYSLLGHVHTIANTTGLQAALDAKQASLGYTPLNPANNLSDVTAATARTNLGATTVGANIFTLANPSAIRFLRINADNTVTARTAAEILADIGAQASGSYLTGNQTITFTPTGDVTGSSSNATSLTPVLTIGALKVTNGMLAGSIAYSKLLLTGAILNADLAGSIAASKLVGSDITLTESQTTNLVTDLAAKAPLASPAFTGTPTGIGIPVYARVTSSDATTTGQALTNVTGLTVALTTNAVYEFEAVLSVTTSAVTTGTQYGVQYSVAGGAIEGGITGPLTSTAAKAERIAALNTATSAYLTTSAQTGQVIIKGIVTTGANAGNLTIQHLKVTSGTSTIKVNSFLKVTRVS